MRFFSLRRRLREVPRPVTMREDLAQPPDLAERHYQHLKQVAQSQERRAIDRCGSV